MLSFGQHGSPEAVVDFDYPEEEPQAELSAIAHRMEGFRTCLHWLGNARTPHALFIKVQAAKHVFTRSNESVTEAANRLGVSRKHFSEAISEIRRVTRMPEEKAMAAGIYSRGTS